MDLVLQLCSLAAWFPLKVLVISAILRCGVRRYPLIFAYSVTTFFIVAAELPVAFAFHSSSGRNREWFQLVYSIGQNITYALIVAVVINLIHRASSRIDSRHLVRFASIAGALIFAVISFLLQYDRRAKLTAWMTPWTRDLSFFAAILDLLLWALLLAARDKDQRLLMLTGGMGIMFAGEAIADAMRSMGLRYHSAAVFFRLAALVVMISDSAFLYIWWQAFRKEYALRKPNPIVRTNMA
jgi:hypothetical protein